MRIGLTHIVGWAGRTREFHQNWRRLLNLVTLAACLLFGLSDNTFAQAEPNESLDQELMRDLGGDPRDDIDRDLLGPETAKPPGETAPEAKDDARRAKLQERLRDDSNPMVDVARRMHDAAALLEKGNGARMTQNLQEEILTDLDSMIKQAKQSACKQGGNTSQQTTGRAPSGNATKPPEGQGGGKPTDKPAAGSSQRDTSTASRKVDPEQLQSLMKRVWGDLPQRAREQVMQVPAEAFLPQYETLIEDYFRRLSESGSPTEGRSDEK